MSAKISMLVICVEVIIYLLLINLHDCTLNIYFLLGKGLLESTNKQFKL